MVDRTLGADPGKLRLGGAHIEGGRRDVPSVGSIEYDLDNFRITVRLQPQFLQARALDLDQHIPEPLKEFSLQQKLALAAARDYSGTTSSAFTHRTLSSVGKYWARVDGTVRVAVTSIPLQ